jgi:acetyl esterase/lipase
VEPDLTSLDVYPTATGCRRPVVVWVHGGGYRTGDKRNAVADKVRWAHEHGWVLVSVNYRLTRPGDPTSARFPDHYDDVAAAIAWVRDHIGTHGGDRDRVAVLGHSAGADIVANVLVVPDHLRAYGERPRSVRCGGPLDTEGFDKPRASAHDPDGERAMWQVALGNEPDYLTLTSATLQIAPGRGIPPMIGVVRGTPRRRAIEQGFLDALTAAGVPARGIEAGGLTHAQVNRAIGAPGDAVMTPPLTGFLTDCFG